MIKFEDLKFMQLFGNCACIGYLGSKRIKGPVDNVIGVNVDQIKLLFTKKYAEALATYPFEKAKRKPSFDGDYDFFHKFSFVWTAHHDPFTEKYKQELTKRLTIFYNFLEKVKTTDNHYFTINLNEMLVNKKQHTLNEKKFIEIVKYLKSENILNKCIFIGTKCDQDTKFSKITWDYWAKNFYKYVLKYDLKYIELLNISIWKTEETEKQFKQKVMTCLTSWHTQQQFAICACAKNENLYINDWIEYHRTIGVKNFYIFDNNDSSTKSIENYIKNLNGVTIINTNDMHFQKYQLDCYNTFYQYYKDYYNWIAFIDIDEFITGINDINIFLQNKVFEPYNMIRLKWKLFGDDNVIKRDTAIPVYKFFKQVITNNKVSDAGKSIIRGNLTSIKICSTHYASYSTTEFEPIEACLPSGQSTTDRINLTNYNKETVFLNHYMTKTLDEFIKQKINRGDALWSKKTITLDYFWQINKKTNEKEAFINSSLKVSASVTKTKKQRKEPNQYYLYF